MTNENAEEYILEEEVAGIEVSGIKKGRKQIKNKIHFNLSLNVEQKEVKANILRDTISVLTGKAGSGKTLLATQIALEYLFYREVERIIITRPTVSNEDIGFLPGDIKEKMNPWVAPIHANMYMLYGKPKIDKFINENIIEIAPISFLRGRTFVNACVIVDEAQNVTKSQMEMILSRLGTNSKMLICGDVTQTDLKNKKDSGFPYLFNMVSSVPGLGVYELKTNHRHPIVDNILNYFEEQK
jgi:phosphate starvation-inducible protein PhoH and related proteins